MPYTYLIVCVPTGEFYYGVRYAVNCDPSELWVSYFTSSKEVARRIEDYGKQEFKVEVRRHFDDAFHARQWEDNVLRRMKAVERSDCLNQSFGMVFIGRASNKGKVMVRMISTGKYRYIPETIAEQMVIDGHAERVGPPKSTDTRLAISRSHKGKIKSQEHISKIASAQRGKTRGTLEEQFGETRATEIKHLRNQKLKGRPSPHKGKSYNEIYGSARADILKNTRSEQLKKSNPGRLMKGRSYEEMYGSKESDRLKSLKCGAPIKEYELLHDQTIIAKGSRLDIDLFLSTQFSFPKKNGIYQKERLHSLDLLVRRSS